jgi:hypothetical protein
MASELLEAVRGELEAYRRELLLLSEYERWLAAAEALAATDSANAGSTKGGEGDLDHEAPDRG